MTNDEKLAADVKEILEKVAETDPLLQREKQWRNMYGCQVPWPQECDRNVFGTCRRCGLDNG